MVLSEVPSVFPPFVIRGALQLALQNVCSDSCTRPKHGAELLGAGRGGPPKFLAAGSPQKLRASLPPLSFSPPAFLFLALRIFPPPPTPPPQPLSPLPSST